MAWSMWLMGKNISSYFRFSLPIYSSLHLNSWIWGLKLHEDLENHPKVLYDISYTYLGIVLTQRSRYQTSGVEDFHGNNKPSLYITWLFIKTSTYILVHWYNHNSWSVKRKALMQLECDPVPPSHQLPGVLHMGWKQEGRTPYLIS